MSTYMDKAVCPKGHDFKIRRRAMSAGRIVSTYCQVCKDYHDLLAGPLPFVQPPRNAPTHERQIEDRLVKRAKELGGEVRKVQWIGRSGAPDRLVMLPRDMGEHGKWPQTIWVELKAPGKAATFPNNAHERAQHREHERMRKMGQRVEVVDSYERIEEILK